MLVVWRNGYGEERKRIVTRKDGGVVGVCGGVKLRSEVCASVCGGQGSRGILFRNRLCCGEGGGEANLGPQVECERAGVNGGEVRASMERLQMKCRHHVV